MAHILVSILRAIQSVTSVRSNERIEVKENAMSQVNATIAKTSFFFVGSIPNSRV